VTNSQKVEQEVSRKVKQIVMLVCLSLVGMWISSAIAGASYDLTATIQTFVGACILVLVA